MPTHLSPDWLAALDAAAAGHPSLAAATTGVHLVIEQVVTDGDDRVTWHVAINDGTVRVLAGPAGQNSVPLVRFSTDRATARAVADGAITAQSAFMAGNLQVGGDTSALLAHHDLLAGVGEVFAGVPLD
jgi:hypothetical protein